MTETAAVVSWPPPATIVITDNVIYPQRCALYAHYCAVPQAHHICPESWWRAAGKPVATPLLNLCPTCHMDTHAAIDGLIHSPPRDVTHLPLRCVALAKRGIALAADAGLAVAPTL